MRGDLLLLLADGLAIMCLTRALLQWAKLRAEHPLSRFCTQTTDWLVRPLRKITPAQGKWDIACVVAVLLLYYIVFMLISLMALPERFGAKLAFLNALFAALNLLKAAAYVLFLGLIVRMAASFRNPYSELAAIMHRVFEPVLRPFVFLRFRRIDFSGSLLALVLWLWLSRWLPQLISQLNLWMLR